MVEATREFSNFLVEYPGKIKKQAWMSHLDCGGHFSGPLQCLQAATYKPKFFLHRIQSSSDLIPIVWLELASPPAPEVVYRISPATNHLE